MGRNILADDTLPPAPAPAGRNILAAAPTTGETSRPKRKSLRETLQFAGEQIVGLFDLAGGGISGVAENVVSAGAGAIGAVNPNDTYMAASRRARANRIRDPAPVTQSGQAQARVLGSLLEKTHIPQLLSSLAQRTTAPAEVRDFALGAFEAATMGRMPKRAPSATENVIQQGRQQGYLFVPHTPVGGGRSAGTLPERVAEGVAGADTVESVISARNQLLNDQRVAQSIGLKGDFITPTSLNAAIKTEQQAYAALKGLDVDIPIRSGTFFNDLAELMKPKAIAQRTPTEAAAFEQAMMDRTAAGAGAWPVKDVVNTIEKFRADSFRNLGSTEQATRDLGAFQRGAADLLERELESGLAQIAKQSDPEGQMLFGNLLQGYRQARGNLTNLYAVRDSINPTTGTVDAARLAKEAAERRLNPTINNIAELYHASPGSMRNVDRAARRAAIPFTASDATFGILAAGATTAATGSKYGMMAALAPIASRYLARQYATRGNVARAATGAVIAPLPTARRGAVAGYEASEEVE